MTPPLVKAALTYANDCLKQYDDLVKEQGRDFNEQERADWAFLEGAFANKRFVAQFNAMSPKDQQYVTDVFSQVTLVIYNEAEIEAKEHKAYRREQRKLKQEAARQKRLEAEERKNAGLVLFDACA